MILSVSTTLIVTSIKRNVPGMVFRATPLGCIMGKAWRVFRLSGICRRSAVAPLRDSYSFLMKNIKKKIKRLSKYIFITNANHGIWIISSAVLFLVLVVFGLYTYQPELNRSVDALLWGTRQAENAQKQLFQLPVTVVYNSSSEDQKMRMDQFLENLADPTRALQSTELKTTWLDIKTPEAQKLIAKSSLKYLPQVFLDQSIEQHPQFQALQQYVNKGEDFYFIRLAPLEHLQIPPYTGGQVSGADPSQAKVVIQAYESYACDHCATAQDALQKILKEYPGTVSVVYKHFEPGDVYNQLGQGADCAADQNKFSEMQARIFKGQPEMLAKLQTFTTAEDALGYVNSTLTAYAKSIGMNGGVFQTCLEDKIHSKTVEQQTLEAIDYGVNAPPTFFINKSFQSGLLSYDELKTLIDQELKK